MFVCAIFDRPVSIRSQRSRQSRFRPVDRAAQTPRGAPRTTGPCIAVPARQLPLPAIHFRDIRSLHIISRLIISLAMNLGKMTPDKIFSLLMWDTGRLLRKAVDARAGEV